MKGIFKIIVLFFIFSCSNDDIEQNDNIDNPTPTPNPVSTFEFNVNGVLLNSQINSAWKKDHNIHIGTDRNDTSFLISFDENGNFGKIIHTYTDPINGVAKKFTTYRNFSSNYFEFYLTSIDTQNKRVKAVFSGFTYIDPQNLNSESKYINGSFDLPYIEYVPPVANIVNEATINNQYWRATNKYQTRGISSYSHLTLHSLSDDNNKIMITFNNELGNNSLPGIYYFTNSSVINKAQIARFDTLTKTYKNYDCSGVLEIINIWTCIEGTYSFTAINLSDPNDIINIENGKFKLDFNPYN